MMKGRVTGQVNLTKNYVCLLICIGVRQCILCALCSHITLEFKMICASTLVPRLGKETLSFYEK